MAKPVGPFIPLEKFIERAKSAGCEERLSKFSIVTPSGVKQVRFLVNPISGKAFDISDFAEGERLAPSTVEAASRRLGIVINKISD